jgi:hypothetical protein
MMLRQLGIDGQLDDNARAVGAASSPRYAVANSATPPFGVSASAGLVDDSSSVAP